MENDEQNQRENTKNEQILDRDTKRTTTKYRPSLITSVKNRITHSSFISTNSKIYDRNVLQMKIILLGDIAVGKTSIIKRLQFDSFSQLHNATLAIDFTAFTFQIDEDGSKADVLVWDTCGSEKFRAITRSYFNDVNGIILAFDVTNKKSFQNLPSWIDDINSHVDKKNDELVVPIIIVGNKCDIYDDREISFQEASNWCREHGFTYMESSAKSGYNVKNIFEELTQEIMIKIEEKTQLIENSKIENKTLGLSASNLNLTKVSKKSKKNKTNERCC